MTVFSCYISYMYSSSIQVLWYACTCFQKNAEIINHKVDTLNDKNISSNAVTFFENHYLFFLCLYNIVTYQHYKSLQHVICEK